MDLTPDVLLDAYRGGIFPMADSRDGPIYWYAPDPRAVLPLHAFCVSRNLERLVKRRPFEVRVDTAFEAVMRACAGRQDTWISEDIIESYVGLHEIGFAHSVECWKGDQLVGGLYGVSIGGAFFGESMFHRVTDASKVALVHLVQALRDAGFVLLDTQFLTPHLARFGVIEIPREAYEKELAQAIGLPVSFPKTMVSGASQD
ncbi:MAG: leucyl/phenylalanyl-tRNA--protein transferase [Rhodothermales bacterium]|nr:leucyl/phenylalanyl-tRNA--protein transferase [Rhodothermales bacterium]